MTALIRRSATESAEIEAGKEYEAFYMSEGVTNAIKGIKMDEKTSIGERKLNALRCKFMLFIFV